MFIHQLVEKTENSKKRVTLNGKQETDPQYKDHFYKNNEVKSKSYHHVEKTKI